MTKPNDTDAPKDNVSPSLTTAQTILAPVDHGSFFTALDRPAAPTPKLRAAFERHKRMVISKD